MVIWKAFLLAGIVSWALPAGSVERCTKGSTKQGPWWGGGENDPRAHHEEQKPDGQRAYQRVTSRRLRHVGIHRLPKSSGTTSNGGMAAWAVPP